MICPDMLLHTPRAVRGCLRWRLPEHVAVQQAKAKVLAEEEKTLAELRTELTERERRWHETAAEHASTVATAQVLAPATISFS